MLNEFQQLKSYDNFIRNTFKGEAAQHKLESTLQGIYHLVEDYVAFTGRDIANANGKSSTAYPHNVDTPVATPIDKSDGSGPGIMTELMRRFSKAVPSSKQQKLSSRKKQRPPELDLSRIRAGSLASSRLSSSPSRRRKSARPRKLTSSPLRKIGDADSTLNTPNDTAESSRFPTPNFGAQARHKVVDLSDDLVNTSNSLHWTSGLDLETASLTSQLGEKLMHDEALPQRLADEINRAGQGIASSSNITEPVIDDILSNFVGNVQETRHGTEDIPGHHGTSSSDFRIATPKDYSGEQQQHGKIQAHQYRKKRTVAKAFPQDPFSYSRDGTERATPLPKRRGAMKKSDLPDNLDVESFLDTLSYE